MRGCAAAAVLTPPFALVGACELLSLRIRRIYNVWGTMAICEMKSLCPDEINGINTSEPAEIRPQGGTRGINTSEPAEIGPQGGTRGINTSDSAEIRLQDGIRGINTSELADIRLQGEISGINTSEPAELRPKHTIEGVGSVPAETTVP
jgi:hypothetical protein